jgi:taurine---2-oxoglutarate transaminase
VLAPGLATLADAHPSVGEVRGSGVFWALELVTSRSTREPVAPAAMAAVKAGLLDRGLLPFVQDNRIHVVPPCVVTDAQVATALAAYDEVLADLDATL